MNFKILYLYFIFLKYSKIVSSSSSFTNSKTIPSSDFNISTESAQKITASSITTSSKTHSVIEKKTSFPTNNIANYDNSSNHSIEKNNCSSNIINLGFECCSKNCEILYKDEDGTWGVENDQWCGCNDNNNEYKNCSVSNCEILYSDQDGDWSIENDEWCKCTHASNQPGSPPSIKSDCPAKIKREYGCCSLGCEVIYVDKDGSWGEQNGKWCGCGGVSCSPLIQSKGYKCCGKYNCDVYWDDEDGLWGIDQVKKVWCGISNGCIV